MKVLLVSNDAYSLFNKATHFPFGGAELRSWKFATGLHSSFRTDVSVITLDQGFHPTSFDGVTVFPHPERKGPGYWEKYKQPVKRVLRRLGLQKEPDEKLETLLDRIAPDVIMQLGMSPEAVRLCRYCRSNGKKFVFGCASDVDLDARFVKGASGKDISGNDLSGYWEVLDGADAILVQTPAQLELLEKRFNRKGTLLFNPVDLTTQPSTMKQPAAVDVFWVGKASRLKRPELFIALAKALPQHTFRMIVNGADYKTGSLPKNLEVIASVPYEAMDGYFSACRIFVNTSTAEGFANTFLQAAKAGVPVISMNCDPNGMLMQHGAGVLTGEPENELVKAVNNLLGDQQRCQSMAEAGRSYLARYHDEKKIIAQLHDLLGALAKDERRA